MKICRRVLALVLTGIMLVPMLLSWSMAAESSTTISGARHFNVMLVMDGSGSLTMKNGTDPNGYRYDAAELFLGLMTNSGNYVGAIVFDDSAPMPLNTGLRPVSGAVAKEELAEQIRSAQAGGDTDIGSALLEAVDQLKQAQEENGMPSVVILMSDGITDLPHAGAEQLQQSYDRETQAVSEAAENGIQVYSVLLNANGTASTGELEQISRATGGDYREVNGAEDLTEVYTLFYNLIYTGIADSETGSVFQFDENGEVTITKEVPGFGVEELNVIASSPSEITQITAIAPSGSSTEDGSLDCDMLSTDSYTFMKLSDPEAGLWTFRIVGVPGEQVRIDLVFNADIGVQVAADRDSYSAGDMLQAEVQVLEDGRIIDQQEAYEADYLKLSLINAADGNERYEMTVAVSGSGFTGSIRLPDVEESTSYLVKADYLIAGVAAASSTLTIVDNPVQADNHAPAAKESPLTVDVQDSGDGYAYLALDECFVDEDGDALTYALTDSDYSADAVFVRENQLAVSASGLSGSCTVRASDGQSSCLLPIYLNINFAPQGVDSSVDVTVETHKLFSGKTRQVDVSQWFTDADGDALSYAIVDCDYGYDQDGTIQLDGTALIIQTENFKKSNLVLRATDEKGASGEITVHFKVLNWWLIYGGVVIGVLIAAGVVLALAAISIARRCYKGYISVQNTSGNSFGQQTAGGFRTQYPTQRKKLMVNSMAGVSLGKFDRKACIVPLSGRKLRFCAEKSFYYNGRKVRKVELFQGSEITVYATQNPEDGGLLIRAESQDNNFSGGFSSAGSGFTGAGTGFGVHSGASGSNHTDNGFRW